MSADTPLPCHVIAGPLGVGKTTAILDYLRRHAGEQQVGVLVNDFGPVGLDGAILEGEAGGDGLQVTTVPGGCVCCAAAEGLVTSLQRLLAMDLDRLIIEPSGMADPAQVLHLLRQVAAASRLELRPTIALLDPGDFDAERGQPSPYFRLMASAADILVLNRADTAEPGAAEAFRAWAQALDPAPLAVAVTEQGRLADDWFALTDPPRGGAGHDHSAGAHDPAERTGGLTWPAATVFDHGRLVQVLTAAAGEGVDGIAIRRLKGIFRTDRGWFVMQIGDGRLSVRETPARRDSRVDWVSEGGTVSAERMTALLEEKEPEGG
ncbi:MAG TPA: GTP-binding protein [Gammaproteobacteria bacterium]|nr:GTP-binding protein [Gammaproteobacteria bacterium]